MQYFDMLYQSSIFFQNFFVGGLYGMKVLLFTKNHLNNSSPVTCRPAFRAYILLARPCGVMKAWTMVLRVLVAVFHFADGDGLVFAVDVGGRFALQHLQAYGTSAVAHHLPRKDRPRRCPRL